MTQCLYISGIQNFNQEFSVHMATITPTFSATYVMNVRQKKASFLYEVFREAYQASVGLKLEDHGLLTKFARTVL